MKSFAILLASAIVVIPLAAQEHAHPAATAEKLGTVHFEISCVPRVKPQFDRAVALLHSFEFGAAIKGFESVLAADSTCAMAYWGLAMSRWSNPMAAGNRTADQLQRGRAAVAAANRHAVHATEREIRYVRAVSTLFATEPAAQRDRIIAYEKAMANLASQYPTDTEAQIFYALSLAASASPTDKTYANQRKAGAILGPLWAAQPSHPGLAHYIIHTYDYPALASEAAEAARGYALIAPSAAHALHMPSHIFTRTGYWKESIQTNLKSMDIALSSASIGETLHAADYAAYAYLQLRQEQNARGILEKLPSLVARFDVNAVTGAAPGSAGVFAIAAIPARFALEREAWAEAASLQPTASSFPWTEAMTHFARALGAARTKDFAKARMSIDSLAAIRQRLADRDEAYWSEQVAIQHLAASAWVDHGEGRVDSALAKMKEAATREDATEKNAVTPGPLAPSRELLGDMLMELNRPAEALAEYQKTLTKEPNRYRSIAGAARAAAKSGNKAVENEMKQKLSALTART